MNIIEASRQTGVSRDMIRFYEKKGIILPVRNPHNGYRSYTEHDILMIVLARQYSIMGVSLDSIAAMFSSNDINKAHMDLTNSIHQMELETQWIRARLFLAKDIQHLHQLMANKQEFDTGKRSDVYFYSAMKNDIAALNTYLSSHNGASRAVFRVAKDNLYRKEFPIDYGLFLLNRIPDRQFQYEKMTAHTYCRTVIAAHKKINGVMLKEIAERMALQGYIPSGYACIYQIMGSTDLSKDDLTCIEFEI